MEMTEGNQTLKSMVQRLSLVELVRECVGGREICCHSRDMRQICYEGRRPVICQGCLEGSSAEASPSDRGAKLCQRPERQKSIADATVRSGGLRWFIPVEI